MTALTRSTKLIANKEFRFKGRPYLPGDRFDTRHLDVATERKVKVMIEGPNRQLVELSPATMAKALKYRPIDSRAPYGFSLAGLLGLNLITQEQIQRFGWEVAGQEPEGELDDDEGREGGEYHPPEGSTAVEDLWVIPVKSNGGPPRFDVVDASGTRIKTGGTIAGQANATKFATEFLATRAAAGKPSDPPPAAKLPFDDFPSEREAWTGDQVAEFDQWFDALEPTAKVVIDNPAAVNLFKERRDAQKSQGSQGS
jgi:hypothetical protein